MNKQLQNTKDKAGGRSSLHTCLPLKTKRALALTVLYFFLCIIQSFAGTITSAGNTGNWNSTATWSGGVVPTSADDVIIAAGSSITVTASTTCKSISFNASTAAAISATISVNSGITLTITNALTITDGKNNIDLTLSGAGTVTCSSVSIGVAGTSPTGSAITTATLHSTITAFNISTDITLNGNATSNSTKVNNPQLDLQSGTMTVSNSIVSTTNGATSGSGPTCSVLMNGGTQTGTLILNGSSPWSLVSSGLVTNTTTVMLIV